MSLFGNQNDRRDTAGRRRNTILPAGLVLLAVILIRLPLWLLPGPGRDEAAYRYWAHHFEPAFTPLMQLFTNLFEIIHPHSLWALRGQVIVLGFLALYLNDRRLRDAGSPPPARLLAVAAVALTPWQSFAGSILHPDNYLLVALLGFVLAAVRGRVLLTALAAWVMVLAKPTGVVLLPVAWWMIGRLDSADRWRPYAARALLGLALLFFLFSMETAMVRGIADFGRLSGSVALPVRIGAALIATIFIGGPLLIGLAVTGFRQRLRLLRSGGSGRPRREAEASLVAAAALLVFFIAAALLRGQFKANWVMPALVLLLPAAVVRIPRRVLVPGLVIVFLASLGQTAGFCRPQIVGRAESALAGRGLSLGSQAYSVHAGVREAVVSSGRTWQHHLAQYGDASAFAGEIRDAWSGGKGGERPPAWIVSDDYGLAFQLHWYLDRDDIHVVIAGDGIFHRTMDPLLRAEKPGPLLLLPVHVGAEELSDRMEIVATLPGVRHPVTGDLLFPCVARLKRPRHEGEQS